MNGSRFKGHVPEGLDEPRATAGEIRGSAGPSSPPAGHPERRAADERTNAARSAPVWPPEMIFMEFIAADPPHPGKSGPGPPYSSRSADAMGWRAARMAGSRPPTSPISVAQTMPWTSSRGVTANANVSWLKLCQFIVAAWNPLKTK